MAVSDALWHEQFVKVDGKLHGCKSPNVTDLPKKLQALAHVEVRNMPRHSDHPNQEILVVGRPPQ